MNDAVSRMLAKYRLETLDDHLRALREILQEIALLGLWRSKFFEHTAFYGGTALRILHGLDRFSEDLDFSLLKPISGFNLSRYAAALQIELQSFGFDVRISKKPKAVESRIQSAFLKAETLRQLIEIRTSETLLRSLPPGQSLKIKLEVDTDPPPGFETEARYLLTPIPFTVRAYTLPDLFAGKMHAILCRRWKTRVKGREWYDLVWFVANHPRLRLSHLKARMVQTGDWPARKDLTPSAFHAALRSVIESARIEAARREVTPFVPHPEALEVWSPDFFLDVARRIQLA
jgi:predicted nucleotidyltransferase component of viral defense system